MSLILRPSLEVRNNSLTTYFPINTKDKKEVFNWDDVLGFVVKTSFRKNLYLKPLNENEQKKIDNGECTQSEIAIHSFKNLCEKAFAKKLDDNSVWPTLEKMYFENGQLFKIAPEFLLFKTIPSKRNNRDSSLGEMFTNQLQDFFFEDKPNNKFNFIEKELYFELMKLTKRPDSKKPELNDRVPNEAPYLPFLANYLQKDLHFLGKRPKYLLTIFKEFLRLYAHLYTVQLTLNLNKWRDGEPKPQLCYYILDNEKASHERYLIQDYGYKQFSGALGNLFPYLSMNESLQQKKINNKINTIHPLWAVAKNLSHQPESSMLLKAYAQAFKADRDLSISLNESEDPLDALADLLKMSRMQFASKQSRHQINKDYVKVTESEFCGHFIQSRSRAGKVLVFNQDYLLLLTNLAIGDDDKLRFHELIKSFESRGVFFDKKSQQSLVSFYERIGNVERMSDSGDAVYVRKTI